ncbi:hypothetical protein SAMN05444521_0731 [Streptomyces sp. 3214.6]|nr:hypothetical protein SAMN05444521_0731 [Streptomyces sp. 3214.6]
MTDRDHRPGAERNTRPEPGVVLRPEVFVLGDEALVPESNMVRPAPTRFTHELVVDEPFHFDGPERGRVPDGQLPAGTRVVVLAAGDDHCRVADAEGLCVDVRRTSLRKLTDA